MEALTGGLPLAASTVDAVVWVALAAGALALIGGLAAWIEERRRDPKTRKPRTAPSGRRGLGAAAFTLAFVFMALAGTVALVGEEVGEPASDKKPKQKNANDKVATTPDASAWALGETDVAAFTGDVTVQSGELGKKTCLMAFYVPTATDRSAKWWTPCKVGRSFESVAQMRERLAIPTSWDKSRLRTGRVTMTIPVGAEVHYLRGTTARQCPPAETRCYEGGAVQYRLLGIDSKWPQKHECAKGSSEQAKASYAACKA